MKVITIGRSTENNDIVVNDEKVSRNHLQMVMDDNGNYSVVDLGSTNGTYVNGQRIFGEVRLQPSDEVRIGQTVLPWQNYFATSSQTPIVKSPLSPQSPKPNPNRTWIYIVIGAVLLLLIGGGVTWKIYHDKQKEKIEQEERDKEQQERQLEQEANDARVEAARLSEEAEAAARRAEEAARKAAETNSEKDRAYAAKMKEEAEAANRQARKKEMEWKEMEKKMNAAHVAEKVAKEQSRIDSLARVRAEEKSKSDSLARINAEKAAQLTKEFYGLISKIKPRDGLLDKDYYKIICDELNLTPKKGEDKREYIIRQFDIGDNAKKQKIVNAVKKVLGQQVKEEAKVESEANPNVENVEQPKSEINDTIKQ